MKLNAIRLPESVIRKAAVAAAMDAEDAMQKARKRLKRAKGAEVLKVHRETRAQLDLARSLSRQLQQEAHQ
jgi:hypothetical protein